MRRNNETRRTTVRRNATGRGDEERSQRVRDREGHCDRDATHLARFQTHAAIRKCRCGVRRDSGSPAPPPAAPLARSRRGRAKAFAMAFAIANSVSK